VDIYLIKSGPYRIRYTFLPFQLAGFTPDNAYHWKIISITDSSALDFEFYPSALNERKIIQLSRARDEISMRSLFFVLTLILSTISAGTQPSSEEKTFLEAVSRGDVGTVLEALGQSKVEANKSYYHDSPGSAMHEACLQGKFEMAELLFQNGFAKHIEADREPLPLFYALQSGNLHLIEFMLEGVDIEAFEYPPYGDILSYSIVNADHQVLNHLILSNGTAIVKKKHIHLCAERGLVLKLDILSRHRRQFLNYQYGPECSTALQVASRYNQIDMIKWIIENNHEGSINKKDKNGRTALHYAVMGCAPEAARILVENGAFINCQTDATESQSPLHYAYRYEHKDMADLLINLGANRDLLDGDRKKPHDLDFSKYS